MSRAAWYGMERAEGGRAAGEVAELLGCGVMVGCGVRGEEGLAGPAIQGEHGGDLGDPLRIGGVAA